MRSVPEVLTDRPGGAPRGPEMGITGLQGQFNQRVRLPGNKKRTHSSRSPRPTPLQSQSRGPAPLGSQPLSAPREGSWAPGQNTRGPWHLVSEGRVTKMCVNTDKCTVYFQYQMW